MVTLCENEDCLTGMIHAIIISEFDEEQKQSQKHFSSWSSVILGSESGEIIPTHCSEQRSNSDIYWCQHFIITHEADLCKCHTTKCMHLQVVSKHLYL